MKYLAAILLIAALFIAGWFTGRHFQAVPEIVIQTRDSIIYKPVTVYKDRPIPAQKAVGPINFYTDTLRTDSIDIIITDSIRGDLVSRKIEHRPIVFQRYISEIQYKPTPTKPRVLSVYGDIKAGLGSGFMAGFEVGIIRKRTKIGIGIMRFDKNYYCVSYGYIIDFY